MKRIIGFIVGLFIMTAVAHADVKIIGGSGGSGAGNVTSSGSVSDGDVVVYDGAGGTAVKSGGALGTSSCANGSFCQGSSTAGSIETAAANISLATTGTITALTKIVTVTGNCTFGTDCDSTSTAGLNGGFVLVTAAAVVTLSAGVVGQMACFYERDASEALSVKPGTGQQIVLNGTLLDANHKVTSASGAGDFICLAFLEAGKWYSLGRSGTWTDGAE